MRYATFVIMALSLAGCGSHSTMTADNASQKQDAVGSCTEMKTEQANEILAKVKNLQLGDTRESVISSLGRPSLELNDKAKESDRVIGYTLSYFLKKCGSTSTSDENDRIVRLSFGVDGRLRLIEGINIPSVETRSIAP
ncbi:hypothetical protein [Dyella subtropica]|uniref:hypothetical protein n=1 Tax=Dyella subtropica TaxID=2992127 RepID=UPI00224DE0E2|nr:hypothetical protein [Dyella subtropica]